MYEKFSDRERRCIFLENTQSTNNDVKAAIRNSDEPLFTVIFSKSQSGGRGRLGRSFFSPDGGLYFSFSIPLNGDEKNIPFITLLAGICVREAVRELTSQNISIKWPNDIYLNGKKLGGILCELVSGKGLTAVVGIGINLSVSEEDIPPELRDIMTSFVREGIAPPDRYMLAEKTVNIMDAYIYSCGELYNVSQRTAEKLREYSCSIGKKVKYTINGSVTEGVVTDIKNTGAAVIRLDDGTEREIFCGEIT